jgi:ABC-2 type transport system permease protein
MLNLRAHSMRNVWLIAQREYFERVRTRGFLITTILIPVVMGAFVIGSIVLGTKTTRDINIAVVSSDTQLVLDLQTELQLEQQESAGRQKDTGESSSAPAPGGKQPGILVDAIDPGSETRTEMDHDLESGDLDGYLWITPASSPSGRPTFVYTPRSSDNASVRNLLASALEKVLIREQLTHRGIVAADADTMLQPVQIAATQVAHTESRESTEVSVFVLFFVMYLVIMLYGMNVARSIIDEKTSRIFEVMLATIRPEAMMAGKIIGVGGVGLTQVAIWLAAVLALAGASIGVHLGGDTFHISLSAGQVIFFFVYFILGYLLYASIAAALGAMTNSEQELQQFNMVLVLPLLFCFVMLGTLVTTPDSTAARILALVPPFTPLLMYLRVSLGHPAVWEIALSLILTSASILATIWITRRIYRIGVLMYGKRPSLPEMLRWVKYS